jgi:hypothetical protein
MKFRYAVGPLATVLFAMVMSHAFAQGLPGQTVAQASTATAATGGPKVGAARVRTAKATRHGTARAHPKKAAAPNPRKLAERRGYKKVSSLVNFPSFFPGIGILYVKPNKLPNGPFLAFDRQDRLVSTIYMIPLEDMSNRKKFELAGEAGKNDHVTLYYNGGHAGVDTPHYHFVIWHVDKKGEERVAK